jgi:hypothetical protein
MIMMVVPVPLIGVLRRMMIVVVYRKGRCDRQGAGARRRHHARKLGDQEQADQ